MKKLIKLVLFLMLISMLAACGGPTAAPTQTDDPTVIEAPADTEAQEDSPSADTEENEVAEEPEPQLSESEQWAKDNGVGMYMPETEDWEKIEAAAKAEGSLTVYSNSSRILDAAAVWAELYPEIKVEAFDLGDNLCTTHVKSFYLYFRV